MTFSHIGLPTDLKPKTFFNAAIGETMINVDGAIEIMRQTNTLEAKAIWRAFRKRLATTPTGILTPEKHRQEVFFAALRDVGHSISMVPMTEVAND